MPSDPASAVPNPQSQRIFRLILALFVLAVIGTLIFSWTIVNSVRRDAREADRGLLVAAWMNLVYVDRTGGFATSMEQLRSVSWQDELSGAAVGIGWPNRAGDLGLDEMPRGADAIVAEMAKITIHFQSAPELPPHLSDEGFPTSIGQLARVNGWLEALSRELMRRRER